MIKKILATVCAIGLIFASCFVGHKIDSKADMIVIPNESSRDYYLQNINGTLYVPFFSAVGFSTSQTLFYVDVLLKINRTVIDNSYATEFGGGFAIMFSRATANETHSDDDFIVTYSNSFTPDFQSGSDFVPHFEWSTSDNEPSFPTLTNGTFSVSSSLIPDHLEFTINSNTDSNRKVTLSFWLRNITGYRCSLDPTTSWKTTPQSYPLIFVAQFGRIGGIYTQQQYEQYGKEQYTNGQQVGYDKGYSAGIADGGSNSFLSLITAVVDAPITAFTSLLNFEVFGFNLKSVVLSILTAALVIACVRFFSGKFTS